MSLALFPLNTVLFSGCTLDLQIFEARYLDMIGRCMKKGEGFGVVCILGEASADDMTDAYAVVGCEALIRDFKQQDNGSGKSTTLYSTLRHLSSPAVNIVTVEDPIEMVYEDFNQIAVQPHIDVTFASILRNILRQDPDIVMIGEIRDEETARYAVQAALTGHLVFSTLHTNDAASAVTRLMDLGLEPYLISSTLLGVVAQRLVRMVCRECERPVEVPAERINTVGCTTRGDIVQIMEGAGCARCRKTGYWGRIGIYEILEISGAVRKMIHAGAPEHEIRTRAIKEGMTTLKEDACRKMFQGITTLEEVMRCTA